MTAERRPDAPVDRGNGRVASASGEGKEEQGFSAEALAFVAKVVALAVPAGVGVVFVPTLEDMPAGYFFVAMNTLERPPPDLKLSES